MDDAPTLIGRHLVRTFGDGDTQTTALDDVSIDLFRGQLALLMGPRPLSALIMIVWATTHSSVRT